MGGISGRNKVSVQFSMSGMTDIIFLLLIFFMLTSTAVTPTALKLTLPQSSNKTDASPQVAVSINSSLNYFITLGRKNVSVRSITELENKLVNELTGRVDPTISLHADKNVPIDNVVQVMNIAKRHKYKLILATKAE